MERKYYTLKGCCPYCKPDTGNRHDADCPNRRLEAKPEPRVIITRYDYSFVPAELPKR